MVSFGDCARTEIQENNKKIATLAKICNLNVIVPIT